MAEVRIHFPARPYQQEVIDYFRRRRREGKRAQACEIWHRKAGKDRTATFIESEACFERVGLYWHALPKYEDARKVIWDAITPDGKRLIDVNFPKEVIRKKLDHEMKLELVNGSIWQPVGADNYDSLVGAFPVHVTWSEYAIMNPQARNFIRPALAMSNGSELIISTTRGYNHCYETWSYAQDSDAWHKSLLTVDDTNVVPPDVLEEERRTMPDALFRQEYYCDWSAANVGAILGRYIEAAEKSGRISDDVEYDLDGADIVISSDLGRRHVSAWWFWQPMVDGFALVDYDEDAGLDPDEWFVRIEKKLEGRRLGKIWLPHDARAKTFSAKHSSIELFLKRYGDKVGVVPRSNLKSHSITAGQVVMRHCKFHKTRCARGLSALRSWSYKYDEERHQYSKEPDDTWAQDAADAFCEGAKIMQEREIKPKSDKRSPVLAVGPENTYTMNDAWADRERSLRRGRWGARI